MVSWEELEGEIRAAEGPGDLRAILASIDDSSLRELSDTCFKIRLSNFGDEVGFFRPWEKFPPISITGTRCELMCKYCRGRYLRGMLHAETPEELWELCCSLARKGISGVLISGGFNREGVLPIRPFLKTIEALKEELGLKIAIHPGLVDRDLAEDLASAGVDVAMCDVVGDEYTIREVIGLSNVGPEDYMASLIALREAGIPALAPHVCLGVAGGELRGELRALRMAEAISPEVLVLLVFLPTRGTPFWGLSPPGIMDVAKLMVIARLLLPKCTISLGCMRPKGRYKALLDPLAVRLGVNRIALPSRTAIEEALRLGLKPRWYDICCAVP